jgi:hypothetical protein
MAELGKVLGNTKYFDHRVTIEVNHLKNIENRKMYKMVMLVYSSSLFSIYLTVSLYNLILIMPCLITRLKKSYLLTTGYYKLV